MLSSEDIPIPCLGWKLGGAMVPQPISHCMERPQPCGIACPTFPTHIPTLLLPWQPPAWWLSAFCNGMSHPVPSPCSECPPGGMRGMWGADVGGQGGYFVGCQAGHCCSPRRIKGTVFPRCLPKGKWAALLWRWPHPARWDWAGSHQDWHPGLCGVSRGAVGWRSLSPGELVAGMEALGCSAAVPHCCRGVRSCWPPSLIPPALLSSLHPSLCPSLHPFSVVLPAQDVPASLSLASCQPFPTLPNPGLQPWLLMPWEQLLKSPRARATGPGP